MWLPATRVTSYCNVVKAENATEEIHAGDIKCDLMFGSWTYDTKKLELTLHGTDKLTTDYIENEDYELVATFAEQKANYYACCKEPYAVVIYTLILREREKDNQVSDVQNDSGNSHEVKEIDSIDLSTTEETEEDIEKTTETDDDSKQVSIDSTTTEETTEDGEDVTDEGNTNEDLRQATGDDAPEAATEEGDDDDEEEEEEEVVDTEAVTDTNANETEAEDTHTAETAESVVPVVL